MARARIGNAFGQSGPGSPGEELARAFARALPLQLQKEGGDLPLRQRAAPLQFGQPPPPPVAGLAGQQTGGGRGAVYGTFTERLAVSATAAGEKLKNIGNIAADVGGVWLTAGKQIESFVAKANPGAVQRFTFALEDTQAVLGQRLAPVLEIVTRGIRLFADVINTILPSGDEFAEALKPISDLLDDLREALAPVASFIHDVLVVALKAFGVALKIVLLPFQILARLLTALFGGGQDSKLKSSTGAAIRDVSFGSPEQFAQNVYKASLMGGVQRAKEPYEGPLQKVIDVLEGISSFVESIADFLGALNKATPGTEVAQTVLAPKTPEQVETQRRAVRSAVEATPLGPLAKLMTGGGLLNPQPEEAAPDERESAGDLLTRWLDQAKRRHLDGHPGSF